MSTLSIQDIARPGTRWSKAAIREIVQRFKFIKQHNGGVLTASAVLEDARDEESPLHRYFEWDDSKAAESWRMEQARKLIQVHYVIVSLPGEEPLRPVRAEVIIKATAPDGGRAYVSTITVMRKESYSAQVLARARDEMRMWVERYSNFLELKEAVEEAKKVLKTLA